MTPSLRSTAARSRIGLLKTIDTGIPTPTVVPLSGWYSPTKVRFGSAVVKVVCSVSRLPSEAVARTRTS